MPQMVDGMPPPVAAAPLFHVKHRHQTRPIPP
jgi:hypothetical protein